MCNILVPENVITIVLRMIQAALYLRTVNPGTEKDSVIVAWVTALIDVMMTKIIKKPGLVNAPRMCVWLASRRKWDQQLSHIKMKGALLTIWMSFQQPRLPRRIECSITRQELKHLMNLHLQQTAVICQWIKWWQNTKKPNKLPVSGRLRIHSFMWVCNQWYSSANQVCSNFV